MAYQFTRDWLRSEDGSFSVSGVLWFALFAVVTGSSADITHGFQSRTMLQATADAAVLAAIIDLPREDNAVNSALEYAELNMPAEQYGNILRPEDVEIGKWDHDNRIFTVGDPNPDAVRVTLQQTAENANSIPTSFLPLIGVDSWDTTVYAIAQKFIPRCFTDGLVARGFVDTSSNNEYYNQFCVHGQQGVYLQSGNVFEPDTNVSMPDLDMLQIPSSGMDSNPGLPAALREGHLNPRMVDHVPEIIDSLLDPSHPNMPLFIDTTKPVITVDWKFNLNNAIPGRIYHVTCTAPNKQISVPSQNVLREVIVISDCQIGVPANAVMEDVILASRAPAGNGGANIHLSANITLGKRDDCADGGGVQIFTTEDLFISSSTTFNGFQAVSAKNVTLGASDEGVKGLSVQAAGNIYLSSGNMFGLCSGDDPLLFTHHFYRLVF